MKLIKILRYLKGYVRFTATGGFPERFINLCAAENIHLWSLKPGIKTLEGCVKAGDFFKLRIIARKSGVRLSAGRRSGLSFFMKKHKNRAVLIAGIFFFAISVIVMNQYIWFIDVEGTSSVSHALIKKSLEDYGLKKGVYSKSIDTELINREGVNRFDGRLMWMSVNIRGSKAVVEVRDYIDEHEDTTYKEPCNIVADFDGTVLSVEIFNGDRAVRSGNAVKKGDLLISGVIENTDFSASYLEARGRITAFHNVKRKKSYPPVKNAFKRLTDSKSKSYFSFLWLSSQKNDGYFRYDEFIKINDTVFPFGISAVTKKSFSDSKDCNYSLLMAIDSYTEEYYRDFANTNIINSDTRVSLKDNKYIISSDINCIDYMGEKKPIYVDKE